MENFPSWSRSSLCVHSNGSDAGPTASWPVNDWWHCIQILGILFCFAKQANNLRNQLTCAPMFHQEDRQHYEEPLRLHGLLSSHSIGLFTHHFCSPFLSLLYPSFGSYKFAKNFRCWCFGYWPRVRDRTRRSTPDHCPLGMGTLARARLSRPAECRRWAAQPDRGRGTGWSEIFRNAKIKRTLQNLSYLT